MPDASRIAPTDIARWFARGFGRTILCSSSSPFPARRHEGRATLHPMSERPPVWIGHAVLRVADVGRSADYWTGLGLREVERNEHVAVLELRGGTHLVLVPGPVPDDPDAPFDLM